MLSFLFPTQQIYLLWLYNGNEKVVPGLQDATKLYRRMKALLQVFLTLVADWGCRSASGSGLLTLGKRTPRANLVGSWVYTRNDMEILAKEEMCTPAGSVMSFAQPYCGQFGKHNSRYLVTIFIYFFDICVSDFVCICVENILKWKWLQTPYVHHLSFSLFKCWVNWTPCKQT